MIKLRQYAVAKFKMENWKIKDTFEDIEEKNENNILEAYAKVSRFNGKIMPMAKQGQATV